MKLNTIVILAMSAALGSNAYALQITKGKLISHKEWATGGAVVKIMPGKKTIKDAMKAQAAMHHEGAIASVISARTEPVSAAIGQATAVQNNGFVMVANETDTTQTYSATLNLCVDLHNNMMECIFSQDIYALEPGGQAFDAKDLTLDLTLMEAGTYNVSAFGMYEGENEHVRSMTSSSSQINVS